MTPEIAAAIASIERERESRVLVFGATHLELDILPELHEVLEGISPAERLDVVVQCRGGVVNAARRIALMLREAAVGCLTFIVPGRCESSGTVMVLAGDEILTWPSSVFSPVDPLLQIATPAGGDTPLAISAQDVGLFATMAADWFGLPEAEARAKAAAILCDNVFPTSLTAFYRSVLEMEGICRELLAIRKVRTDCEASIADRLIKEYHSHTFALSGEDLAGLGLNARRASEIGQAGWAIGRMLLAEVGPGRRDSEDAPWVDVLLATRDRTVRRHRAPGNPMPVWDTMATS